MKYAKYIKPMLSKTGDKPFNGKDWMFEVKYDGYRAIAEINKTKVKLYSRNGLNFSDDYPLVFAELQKLKINATLDGEIVALNKRNKSDFQLLQQASKDESMPTAYYIFDLLELNGSSTLNLPLEERKELLKKVLRTNDAIRYSDHVLNQGKIFFRLIKKRNLEGMMAKNKHSIYHIGKRSGDWLKIKYHHEQEFIIVGFTEPKGERKYFGSVILGIYSNNRLVYTGHAGTGFNKDTLNNVYIKMKTIIINHKPFTDKIPSETSVTWIKPVLVCNVRFTQWTRDGQVRHPVFLGLRKDKKAREVVKE